MNIRKALGLDDKHARTERNKSNNWHSTVQWLALCAVIAFAVKSCS